MRQGTDLTGQRNGWAVALLTGAMLVAGTVGHFALTSGLSELALAGSSSEQVPPEYGTKVMPAGWRTDPTALAAGKAIYEGKANPEVNCVHCHGSDGKPTRMGKGAMDLSDLKEHAQDSDALWFGRLAEGKPGTKMPGYKTKLTEEQRWQVIAYMRSFSAKSKP